MKVEFETNYRELAEAMWLATQDEKSKNARFNIIFFYVVVAALGSVPFLMFAPHFIYAAIDFAVIFTFCFYYFRPPSLRSYIAHCQKIYGTAPLPYEVELYEESLKISGDMSTLIVSWKRIEKIIESEDGVFLVLTRKSGLKIPKTAFETASNVGQFISFATSRIPSTHSLNDRNRQQST